MDVKRGIMFFLGFFASKCKFNVFYLGLLMLLLTGCNDLKILKRKSNENIKILVVKLGNKDDSIQLKSSESQKLFMIIVEGKKVQLIKNPFEYRLHINIGNKTINLLVGNDIVKKDNSYYKLSCNLGDSLNAFFR